MKYDAIVVGIGYAGAVCARRLAEEANKKVLLIDKRNHIAGNMYDEYDEKGILVHRYGPHISVMNEDRVYKFLSRFTAWHPYLHRVNALIDGIEVPLPINFTSIDLLFSYEKASEIKSALSKQYGAGSSVAILDMKQSDNTLIRDFADFVFEKVFLHYTEKMWGLTPEQIDPAVTARIPIRLSYDNRHFQHKYQVMPEHGFTKLFEKMLDHPNIDVRLNTNAKDILCLNENTHAVDLKEDGLFSGEVIYTGALDELFDYRFGELPYRSLQFEFNSYPQDYIQDSTVLNWPDKRSATRRTEMKRLTGQRMDGWTSTITEYPGPYQRGSAVFGEPLYPINNSECLSKYEQYKKLADEYSQIILVGRLADYKYYNMESTIKRALEVCDRLMSTENA